MWAVWDDATDDNRVSGVDFSTTFTVVVSGAANSTSAVGTLSAVNSLLLKMELTAHSSRSH